MMKYIFLICSLFALANVHAQRDTAATFTIIPLGVEGGLDESNLSSYMLAVNGTQNYVNLDAGTLYAGVQKAIQAGIFTDSSATQIIRTNIKGYLISHGHLDHSAGLIINSPEDTSKNIYAMPYTLDVLQSDYFTWKSWANFTDAGDKPTLNKYHYVTLQQGNEMPLANTAMYVTAFELSHAAPYKSTAFLIRHDSSYVLYLGDTGADSLEKSNKLALLWSAVAPLVIQHRLKAIFIETSYSDAQPLNKLFGHLTPTLVMKEMHQLANYAGIDAMKNLNVLITHIKPSGNAKAVIQQQLQALNNLDLNFIFPQQAAALHL